MAYGAGIVWIVEPLLARMISGPKQFLPAYHPVILASVLDRSVMQ